MLFPFPPHPSQNMLGKPESEGWAHSKLPYPSLYIIIIIIRIYVSPKSWGSVGAGRCPCTALARRSCAFSQPSAGRCRFRGCGLELGRASTNAEHHMPKPPRGFAVRPYEGAHASGESTCAVDGAEGSREGERSGQGHGEVFARGRFHLNTAVAEVQPAPLPTVKGRR